MEVQLPLKPGSPDQPKGHYSSLIELKYIQTWNFINFQINKEINKDSFLIAIPCMSFVCLAVPLLFLMSSGSIFSSLRGFWLLLSCTWLLCSRWLAIEARKAAAISRSSSSLRTATLSVFHKRSHMSKWSTDEDLPIISPAPDILLSSWGSSSSWSSLSVEAIPFLIVIATNCQTQNRHPDRLDLGMWPINYIQRSESANSALPSFLRCCLGA